MTISGKEVIHGTGITSGDIVEEAVTQAAQHGSATPMPGQPTRFLTLTYHHPGNEDGNNANDVLIPDSLIQENDAFLVSFQCKVVLAGGVLLFASAAMYGFPGLSSYEQIILGRLPGQAATFNLNTSDPTDAMHTMSRLFSPAANGDSQFFAPGIKTVSNQLYAPIYGMSDATPTDWTINVQLTPVAP